MIINILSVDFITDAIDLEVNREKKEHGHIRSLFKDQCPELWAAEPSLADTRRLYFSITSNARECYGDKYSARIRLGADSPAMVAKCFRASIKESPLCSIT